LGLRAGLDRCGKSRPGFDPRTFEPVGSRYTDYATRLRPRNVTVKILCFAKMCMYVYRAIFKTIIITSSDNLIYSLYLMTMSILVAVRSKTWICCHALAGTGGFEFHRGHGCLSPVNGVCCHVEVSARGRSLIQRSRNKCGVFECDTKTLTMKRARSNRTDEP